MNWRATAIVLAVIGAATALAGWAWAHSIHLRRRDCRVAALFDGGSACPSKVPAIVVSGVGGVLLVVGLALLVGASSRRA
jgi:hypothetical protein